MVNLAFWVVPLGCLAAGADSLPSPSQQFSETCLIQESGDSREIQADLFPEPVSPLETGTTRSEFHFALTASGAGSGSGAQVPSLTLDPPKIFYREDILFGDLARDQFNIWSSPSEFRRKDLRWMLPLAFGTGVMVATDDSTSQWLSDLDFPSTAVSGLGGPTNFFTAGAVYAIGRISNEPRLRETGLLSLRAVGNTWVTVQTIKQGTNRERPDKVGGEGDFWSGGSSFPSGHSASTWAFATVVAERYPDKKALRWGMYALASSVSFSRLSGERHFPSDVVVGAVVGHLIGRYVVKDWRAKRELLRRQR